MTGLPSKEAFRTVGSDALIALMKEALERRDEFFDTNHTSAFRLFNGFVEGYPDLVVDLYAHTLVLFNHARQPDVKQDQIPAVQEYLLSRMPWVRAVIHKTRHAETDQEKRGIVFGTGVPDEFICENGVSYAVDLLMNQDASLYLDTRNLRTWIKQNLADKTLLDTFAYTGSYGVAARAGGARRVDYLDINPRYLSLARKSYALNGLAVQEDTFLSEDFWTAISQMNRSGKRFDCVIVDPPIFSKTKKGTIDLMNRSHRLINKVRPLINDQGYLVTINNGLFISGMDTIHMLEELCADGYLSIETLIPAPADFTAFGQMKANVLPADPAPFNHPTKIAILRVRRKQ